MTLCQVLNVTRSVYYASLKKKVDTKRLVLRVQARECHQHSRGSAGSRTLRLLMQQRGYTVGRWLARRLMRESGLVSRQWVRRPHYRTKQEEAACSPNRLKRQFTPSEPNTVWCGDISYIPLQGGRWCYLALVIDLYSRKVIGSALSLSPDSQLICRAMRQALESREKNTHLLFHSDQGAQYRSKRYRQVLWRNHVIQSMSRRGNCLDNAPMERVFRSLKSEWLPAEGYRDIRHATQDINRWIYGYYNQTRPHTYNDGLSPCEYERKWKEAMSVS